MLGIARLSDMIGFGTEMLGIAIGKEEESKQRPLKTKRKIQFNYWPTSQHFHVTLEAQNCESEKYQA